MVVLKCFKVRFVNSSCSGVLINLRLNEHLSMNHSKLASEEIKLIGV